MNDKIRLKTPKMNAMCDLCGVVPLIFHSILLLVRHINGLILTVLTQNEIAPPENDDKFSYGEILFSNKKKAAKNKQ